MSEPPADTATSARRHAVSENVVKEALTRLDWHGLERHLDAVGLDEAALDFLLGHLRRASSLIMPYSKPDHEARREAFSEALRQYVRTRLGERAAASVNQEVELLRGIERRYREILETLDQCPISSVAPEARVAAYIKRLAQQYAHVTTLHSRVMEEQREITLPQGPFLPTEDNAQIHPDAAISALVESISITLIMEGIKSGWVDEARRIVLPALPPVGDDEVFKAGATEVLSMCWRRWRRTEERHRFLGGEFEEYLSPQLPSWTPPGAESVTMYRLPSEEVFDFVANERLNDRLTLTFMEMLTETDLDARVVGIEKGVSLPPGVFVSSSEAHAAVSLCEALSYDVARDEDRPGGLRLVEWLRGYAVLQVLAEQKWRQDDPASLMPVLPRDDLLRVLERCGLEAESAKRFVDAATLRVDSTDLFDCPLIRAADDAWIVFAPALLTANLSRVVLSSVAAVGDPSSRKGKAFEDDIRSFFARLGMRAEALRFSRDGEEYEYDVLVFWGDYLFLLECKNQSLSNGHPVQAYYFGLSCRRNARQVRRLADALTRYPEVVQERFGIDVSRMHVVPCVLNAMPFALPGEQGGVFFIDASSLKRFFQERYFHIKSPHYVDQGLRVIHRVAMHSVWEGDQPSPEDLLRHLKDPFQVKLMLAHIEVGSRPFPCGSRHVVVAEEFFRTPMTVESFADLVGVSARYVRAEQAAIAARLKEVRGDAAES